MVVPGSAVPASMKLVVAVEAGAVMTGGAGGRVSTWITRMLELGDVPPSVRARALRRYAPSLGTVIARDHVPAAVATVVPNDVAPSKISTVAPACAVPETVSVDDRLQL